MICPRTIIRVFLPGLALALAGCRTPTTVQAVRPALTQTPHATTREVVLAQYVEPVSPPSVSPTQPLNPVPPQLAAPLNAPLTAPQLLPPPPGVIQEAEEIAGPPLTLTEVTESVYFAYPGLEAALRELEIAAGKEQSAQGEFDLKLKVGSQSDPLGFYKTYKNAVKLEQAMWGGGGVYGQYRIGRGNFPTWEGLETNDGGEFKVGLLRPLLQNTSIDQRRADIMQATLRRQQVDPAVQALLLDLVRIASESYWSWVAASQSYAIQRELLRVTVERNKVYSGRVAAGDLPRIELLQNERLIASREAKLVEAERKLQQSAIKLSLYLRDERGQPFAPGLAQAPKTFPDPNTVLAESSNAAVILALANRPELRELDLIRQHAEVDLAQAENLRRPEFVATLDAAKDVGLPTPKGDKTPFQLQAGLYFDVPLERNKALGKIREAQGKLAQIAAKRRLTENKIEVDVQDALSALATSQSRYKFAQENTRLSWELVTAERARFEAQDSDLLRVALQESSAIEAALGEIDALVEYFKAEAAYRAAIGQPPLAPVDPMPSP